ncbi:hypothetical protein BDR06DRAFT_200899 [Suillus hirtellus]|nr:hypothetical protein BDR06DRAFT_200899 [Suillus hirtellus]
MPQISKSIATNYNILPHASYIERLTSPGSTLLSCMSIPGSLVSILNHVSRLFYVSYAIPKRWHPGFLQISLTPRMRWVSAKES